ARAEVVRLDRTGTVTEGRHVRVVSVDGVDPTVPAAELSAALAALAAADPSPNASLRAVAAALPLADGWTPAAVVPFSSGRRWSGADFADRGVWVLGAPDTLAAGTDAATGDDVIEAAEAAARDGLRVVLLAR